MNNARDNILERLRDSRPALPAGESMFREGETPAWTPEERIVQFTERLEAVRAEVHLVSNAEWVEQLQVLAREKGLKRLLYAPDGPLGPEIGNGWGSAGETELIIRDGLVETWKEELFFGIDGAITSVRAGIAETGTLVLWPSVEEPRTFSLVPPVHFALLRLEKLYCTFAELVAVEEWQLGLPTNALLISGPSKSADIEQTLAYGIHGPVELVVFLIRD